MIDYNNYYLVLAIVEEMAVSPKSIQERVAQAYVQIAPHLRNMHIEHSDWPLQHLKQLKMAFKQGHDEGNDSVQESALQLTDDEASKIAQMIVDILDDIGSMLG